jgi:hypothetical protein
MKYLKLSSYEDLQICVIFTGIKITYKTPITTVFFSRPFRFTINIALSPPIPSDITNAVDAVLNKQKKQ